MTDIRRNQPIDNEQSLCLYRSEDDYHQIIAVKNIVEQYEYIIVSLDIARDCGCVTSGGILFPHMYHRLHEYDGTIMEHLVRNQELIDFHLMFDKSVGELFSEPAK